MAWVRPRKCLPPSARESRPPRKALRKVNVLEGTIAHKVLGQYASSQVLLKPAPAGTGVIAGGAVRAVITACGIPNVLTKSIGRRNPHNVVKATIVALESLCATATPWPKCAAWRWRNSNGRHNQN
jgi:ribosomal protein S5